MNIPLKNKKPLVLLMLAALATSGCSEHGLQGVLVETALQQRLLLPPEYARADPAAWEIVRAAYNGGQGGLLWLDPGAPRRQVLQLRGAVARSVLDGLDPARYELDVLERLQPQRLAGSGQQRYAPRAAAEADLRLSFAAAQLLRDLQQGQFAPPQADQHWRRTDGGAELGGVLRQAASAADAETVLRSVAPQDPQYARLRLALARHHWIAVTGGWPQVPAELKVKPGERHAAVPALRARLVAGGFLDSAAVPAGDAELHDALLVEALKQFQLDHGLTDDGVAGQQTVAELNVPVEQRIQQLQLTLERWRWLPEQLGPRHVIVNVPTFHLDAVEDDRATLQMRVVTGTTRTATPIFSSAMQSVVFSPYWNIPGSILRGEVLPNARANPDYLARKNMEVLVNGKAVDPYTVDFSQSNLRVRQKPGAANSLGHVKFMFPNPFDVYLHDTPQDGLFARSQRNFSHGCVRLEQPEALAQWVLKHQAEWPAEKIRSAMHAGRERHVKLASEIPVYIVYHTAWAGPDGRVRFARDIYGHDARHAALLPPVPRLALDAEQGQLATVD